jgi:hypothetical protein
VRAPGFGYSESVTKTIFVLVLAIPGLAEVHPLTLRQAVDIALKQSPDLVLARLDEQKAQYAIRIAKDPFVPKIYAGSGAAKTWGYPSSIEGAAPSIIEARTDMSLFNRPACQGARERARGCNQRAGQER